MPRFSLAADAVTGDGAEPEDFGVAFAFAVAAFGIAFTGTAFTVGNFTGTAVAVTTFAVTGLGGLRLSADAAEWAVPAFTWAPLGLATLGGAACGFGIGVWAHALAASHIVRIHLPIFMAFPYLFTAAGGGGGVLLAVL